MHPPPDSVDTNTTPTSIIALHPTPLPFSKMFHQYFQLGRRIRAHYLSPRVLLCLLTGKFVPPIHRKNLYSLQYSMLPARRAGIGEMWKALSVPGTSKRGDKAVGDRVVGSRSGGVDNIRLGVLRERWSQGNLRERRRA